MPNKTTDVVADCARMREEARREFTITDAIAEAEWLARTPDGVLAPAVAKQTVIALLAALARSRCYYNATMRGQEVFVLVEQDRAAPLAIETWAALARSHGGDMEKVKSAFDLAQRWQVSPRIPTKWPT